ncbi:MAG: hypothetical protein ACFB5Z_15145 [Elainellaceae cyanobacterium]
MFASSYLFTAQERLESLKTGALSAAIAASVTLSFKLLHAALLQHPLVGAVRPDVRPHAIALLLSAIPFLTAVISGAVSGALFGITYRYIVRQDDNPQLAAGAVGAFGLVRGLALVEVGIGHQAGWALALTLGESVGLFAIAQVVLKIALRRRWLRPFGAASQPPSR